VEQAAKRETAVLKLPFFYSSLKREQRHFLAEDEKSILNLASYNLLLKGSQIYEQ
jgi:hypothetical protein